MKKILALSLISVIAIVSMVGCSGDADPGPAPAFGSKAGPPGQAAGGGGAPKSNTPVGVQAKGDGG